MKRLALVLAALALVFAGIDALADATQNRPDVAQPGSSSRLTLAVKGPNGPVGAVEAQALWAVCNRTARAVHLTSPLQQVGTGQFQLQLEPAVGEYARRRLVGCLEDMTLDGLLGRVTSLEHQLAG